MLVLATFQPVKEAAGLVFSQLTLARSRR